MKVSVIIPVYNVSKYIERCLLSVLNQTWKDLEIILVDDCTPDNSMEIVQSVAASHSRGSIVTCLKHEKNRGQSAARNTGISQAIGEYIYFLDSDDFIFDDCIRLLMEAAKNDLPDFVIGNYLIVGAECWAPPLTLDTGLYEGNSLILSSYVHGNWYVMPWNKLLKRSFIMQNGLLFQEGIIHEDDLWSFKLACLAQKMFVINQPTYNYCIQPNSTMRAPSLRNLQCRLAVMGYIYDYIRSTQTLQAKRDVYIYYETLKAKYFDRILYYSTDKHFQYQSYLIFRNSKYISALKAVYLFHPGFRLMLRNLHYAFPSSMGYLYFRGVVQLEYYCLVVSIKLKRILKGI